MVANLITAATTVAGWLLTNSIVDYLFYFILIRLNSPEANDLNEFVRKVNAKAAASAELEVRTKVNHAIYY